MHTDDVVLHEATRKRYLNYALSVITSRALPDVRDGLKPVQRRILYAMFHNLGLGPDAKYRKSAAIVGEVMGKYHPHGDQSIYDAMVRMAQDFSLRYPLVDGHGNFGSLDGDNAAAMRYTEARLRHLAGELLEEIRKKTVDYRPNYDGTHFEPVVLPAQVPNLLINGATGIAVGMATSIPPHNLGEVVDACIRLIDDPDLPLEKIAGRVIKGPDFPTGGAILNTREEIVEIYRTGSGAIEVQGEYTVEQEGRRRAIIITSIPYALNKATLIGDIADHVRTGKLPLVTDVRDESTEDIRIVLDLRRDADPEAVMAYLYKRTALQGRFNVNLTALIPQERSEVGTPKRLDLREMLTHFLDFRFEVTERRLRFDLEALEHRIHLLRGFAIVFDALDEAIALIRASDGKTDARNRLMDRFALDHEQAEAILETRLYRLAKMEIEAIREELAEKEAAAAELRTILDSPERMWALIRSELSQVREAYRDRRRTRVTGPRDELEFDEENYIVAEDTVVIITREGWMKRQKSYSELGAIRVREGDALGWVLASSTREKLVLFTDRGRAYTLRVTDIPQTTGYGEAVQTRFEFADRERIVGALTTDPRALPSPPDEIREQLGDGDPPPPWIIALSRGGRCLRLAVSTFEEPSTVQGRLLMRLDDRVPHDAVVAVRPTDGAEAVSLATQKGRCLIFPVDEVKILSGAGKGVTAIKLQNDDHVLGFVLTTERMGGLEVETNRGRTEVVRPNKFGVSGRGNRGREIIRLGYIARIHEPVEEVLYRADDENNPPEDGTSAEASEQPDAQVDDSGDDTARDASASTLPLGDDPD
ncbi:MAG: DNA topoisomerase IV subunit A [Deltaproteobacteria bacterium]|nr:MAG: DNA topoisomerase IV subunit A [Deltaproteobacteria bacterium]